MSSEYITDYPPVGSRWLVSLGPEIPRTAVEVVYSGHGSVAIKTLRSKYTVCIGIITWHRLYNPEKIETKKRIDKYFPLGDNYHERNK